MRKASNRRRFVSLGTTLAVDAVTGEVAEAFAKAAVPNILLRGPVLARLIYDDPAEREYIDADFLVPLQAERQAGDVLADLGFRKQPLDVSPHDRPKHATTWVRAGTMVDLHQTLVGAGAPPAAVWTAVEAETGRLEVAGKVVPGLRPAAAALIIALHGAQHGERGGALGELRIALQRLHFQIWRDARLLADRLEAVPAFAAALRAVPEGRDVADALGLPSDVPPETVLRAATAPELALGINRFFELRGFRAKAAFLSRKLLPPPAYMRVVSPLARHDRGGLVAAYIKRLVWMLPRLVPALVAVHRARKQDQRGG